MSSSGPWAISLLVLVVLVATSIGAPSETKALKAKYDYNEVIKKSLLFYAALRSGRLPADNPVPWRGDSALYDVGQNGEDLTGGYYDAGDHVKFGFPMAGTTTVVASSIIDYAAGYSAAGELENARKMVRWATDYFIKAHVEPNKFYGQIGDGNVDHGYWGRPEDMTMYRPSFYIDASKPGSDLAGETAAALAAASMVFADVDPTYSALCLRHAKELYNFAKTYLGSYDQSITAAQGFYNSWGGYGDELTWSAAWLYRATKDQAYLNDAEQFYNQYQLSGLHKAFSWDDKTPGAQILLAQLTGKNEYTTAAKAFCDYNMNAPKTPKGLTKVQDEWGTLRYASSVAYQCLRAADFANVDEGSKAAYRQYSQSQIHYVLGDTGRSYVVGFGVNPPTQPHHRSSSCGDRPSVCDWNNYNSGGPNPQTLYGAMVGGPNFNDDYTDNRSNFQTNEVACDYNSGFQSAVAVLNTLAVKGQFA
jgi:hypothetical protein